jgi:phage tail tube protein FII
MWRNIEQMGAVKGVTGYNVIDGIVDNFPCAVDEINLTLPQITHPTYTIQMMGDAEIADYCRVNAMTTQVECDLSILQTKFLGPGVREYLFKWATEMKNQNGQFRIVPFAAYIAGTVAEDVAATVRVGEKSTGTISINTLKYRLIADNKEIRYIDKRYGILKINGIDYRSEINKML